MTTQSCYGGKTVAHAPVIPSLLAAPMLQGIRHEHGTSGSAERHIVGGRNWRDNSCGGPCAPTALIDQVFGDER